jgi:hypothetical protein
MLREGANKNPRAKIFADEDEEEGGSNNSSALELNEREEELLKSQQAITELLHNSKKSRTEKVEEISKWNSHVISNMKN